MLRWVLTVVGELSSASLQRHGPCRLESSLQRVSWYQGMLACAWYDNNSSHHLGSQWLGQGGFHRDDSCNIISCAKAGIIFWFHKPESLLQIVKSKSSKFNGDFSRDDELIIVLLNGVDRSIPESLALVSGRYSRHCALLSHGSESLSAERWASLFTLQCRECENFWMQSGSKLRQSQVEPCSELATATIEQRWWRRYWESGIGRNKSGRIWKLGGGFETEFMRWKSEVDFIETQNRTLVNKQSITLTWLWDSPVDIFIFN